MKQELRFDYHRARQYFTLVLATVTIAAWVMLFVMALMGSEATEFGIRAKHLLFATMYTIPVAVGVGLVIPIAIMQEHKKSWLIDDSEVEILCDGKTTHVIPWDEVENVIFREYSMTVLSRKGQEFTLQLPTVEAQELMEEYYNKVRGSYYDMDRKAKENRIS